MAQIVVLTAHPYPARSRAHRVLLDAIRDLPGVELRALYERYPDFDIDVIAEQVALEKAQLIVWLHPLFWYGVPSLMKHWFDQVLTSGWAHGTDGRALAGKECLWVVTTGGDEVAYSAQGRHELPFADYVPPIEHTARYCGMRWQEPFVVHGAHHIDDAQLAAAAARLRERLAEAGGNKA